MCISINKYYFPNYGYHKLEIWISILELLISILKELILKTDITDTHYSAFFFGYHKIEIQKSNYLFQEHRHNDVASASVRRHVLTMFLIISAK